ncbi:MAG: hypothetical protein Q4C60_00050 [Eubacteriales bacterium]|nr:hypothetical protein [Eubacteriales bacterium]
MQSTYEGNPEFLCRSVCTVMDLPQVRFASIMDLFAFLGRQNRTTDCCM